MLVILAAKLAALGMAWEEILYKSMECFENHDPALESTVEHLQEAIDHLIEKRHPEFRAPFLHIRIEFVENGNSGSIQSSPGNSRFTRKFRNIPQEELLMSVPFQESETLQNLMRAFAGESQARNRYTLAAEICHKQQLPVLEAVFVFTAGQELAHAQIYLNHMAPLNNRTVSIAADYPVTCTNDVAELLRQAAHHEGEETRDVYPAFAQIARQEGFDAVAASFEQIGVIEGSHSRRFDQLAKLVEQQALFISDAACNWMCLNCGHILTAKEAPKICPVCQHAQGYFIRLELAPWSTLSMLQP